MSYKCYDFVVEKSKVKITGHKVRKHFRRSSGRREFCTPSSAPPQKQTTPQQLVLMGYWTRMLVSADCSTVVIKIWNRLLSPFLHHVSFCFPISLLTPPRVKRSCVSVCLFVCLLFVRATEPKRLKLQSPNLPHVWLPI